MAVHDRGISGYHTRSGTRTVSDPYVTVMLVCVDDAVSMPFKYTYAHDDATCITFGAMLVHARLLPIACSDPSGYPPYTVSALCICVDVMTARFINSPFAAYANRPTAA